jgi:N-hydroxyarylamine O-acetyltransferase
VPDPLDLDAYFDRIGASGSPSLSAMHRAHVTSIPFENLDPHRGVPVSLEPGVLRDKLVRSRRGGYCFEQNLLFKAALDALGLQAELMLARVRSGAPPGVIRPRTHLVLRVHADDELLLADVGFGVGTLLEPIPFGPGVVHEQAGWRYRLIQEQDQLVLQTGEDAAWKDLYAFVPVPVPTVDVETSNWFTSTHPRSPFVTGLIVTAQRPDGSRTSLTDWTELALTEETPEQRTVTTVAREAIPELLSTHFGLTGFALNRDGRVVVAQ